MTDVLIYLGHHGAELVTLVIATITAERVSGTLHKKARKAKKRPSANHRRPTRTPTRSKK